MFTKAQRDLLRTVGRKPNHPDLGKANPQLDQMIQKIRFENPNAFLKDSDLSDRVFMDEPKDPRMVYAGFIYGVGER